MKRVLLSALAAAAMAAPAFAADLPVRTAAPAFVAPVQVFSWTGFYAGLNAGYSWGENRWRSTGAPAFVNFATDGDGFIGGGHVGYNWQINQFVLGLEGQLNWLDNRGSAGCGFAVATCRARQDWLADINLRAGFAVDRALFYVTGGVAFTDYSFDSNLLGGRSWGSGSRTGWTIGAGLDYAITNNWIAGLQYKYYDFESSSSTSAAPGATTVSFRNSESVLQARISYKFGGPAASAVVARY